MRVIISDLYFSYSSFFVYDTSLKAPLPCLWTDAHCQQGFARVENHVQFGTLLEFGWAEVTASVGVYALESKHQRVIEVPFAISSGRVTVSGGPDDKVHPPIALPPGSYRLTAAQRRVDDEHESICLNFEALTLPLQASRVVRADAGLNPPVTLVESVEVTPI
jgi:hypothetical protein